VAFDNEVIPSLTAPVTLLSLEPGTLICLEVHDGENLGIAVGEPLTGLLDPSETVRLTEACRSTGKIDRSFRHRDGRLLRLRANVSNERIEAALIDDTARAQLEASARIEARTLRAL
jgi:hypothetical protein